MDILSEFIEILGLVDLPLQGGRFTWSNFRDRPSFSSYWGPRPFKWFEHLLEDNSYVEKIQEECSIAKGTGIVELLRKCKSISKVWAETKGGNSADTIQVLEKECNGFEKELEDGNTTEQLCAKLMCSRWRVLLE
ncbi:hypothetical protein V6N13_051928 [Hibiscus sabdariffa]